MLPLPFLNGIFVLITFAAVWLFYRASGRSRTVLIGSVLWLTLVAAVSLSGFFLKFDAVPPRLIFALVPSLLIILGCFVSTHGKQFIDSLDPAWLTYLHTIRIPVEVVLVMLFLEGMLPEIMTFEGRNFDILAGLSAPFISWFGFVRRTIGRQGLLIWNLICLLLLFNIVGTAVLSAPTAFQQFGLDQPNVALFYYPFIWLPAYIVPVVLFSHLSLIRQLKSPR